MGKWRETRKVLRYVGRYKKALILSLIFSLISVAFTLYIPVLTGRAIDLIIGPGRVDFPGVISVLLRVGLSAAVIAAFNWATSLLNNRMTYSVVRDIRREAIRKIENLPLSYIDAHPTGETVNRVIADVDQFADGLLMGLTQLFTGVLTILGTLLFMLWVNARVTLVVVLVTPLSLVAASFIARRTYAMFHLQSETRARQTALIDETVAGRRVVTAFGREAAVIKQFDSVNEELARCSLRATFFSSLTNPVTRFVNALVYAGVGVSGALLAVSGSVSVGQLSCFLTYANQYTKPFNEISGVLAEFQNALASFGRVAELLNAPDEPPEPPDAVALHHADGRVQLDHVCFSYTPGQKLIEDLNLAVAPGQRVAIVGPTGCGKTTLINLLMRFYDADAGEIRVSGVDVRRITRLSLRRSYGMVLQETWLKAATVRDQIAYGKPDATEEEIVQAARAAHADSFIRRLPKGYDTVLSDDAASLSQGQKQLLCIARAMLALPPMLILDEATSSIDTRTELKIQDSFARMMKGRTSFIVAHRLSTIRSADRILVMKDGSVIEQGDHKTLLAQNGFYARLWNSQFDM